MPAAPDPPTDDEHRADLGHDHDAVPPPAPDPPTDAIGRPWRPYSSHHTAHNYPQA
ncbi:hypothetical protein AX14_002611 [Amanita brunnescens Koide BX004]|nr:hypothetical protein AX14_002611 [Amanita brunnescens Koide BX004]